MTSLDEGTWHESHVPPSACVHVTHGTWKIKSKCEESEKVSSFWDQTKERRKNSVEGGKETKRKKKNKERKGEKEKKGEKRK